MSTKTDARETVDAILDLLLDALEKRQQQREVTEPDLVGLKSAETKPSPNPAPISTEAEETPAPIDGTPLPDSWRSAVGIIDPKILRLEDVTPAIVADLVEVQPQLLHTLSLSMVAALSDAALDALPLEVFNQLDEPVQREVMARLGIEEALGALGEEEDGGISAEIELSLAISEEAAFADPPPDPIRRGPLPSTGMHHTVRRMFVVLIFFVIVANIPINYSQLNEWLGTSANDGVRAVRVVRDGLLIRAADDHKVYVMENNQRRWITTREAFDAYDYRWSAVRVVDRDFLEQFEEGDPLYLLMQCYGSPHIFALDTGGNPQARTKRWIKDVPTLESMRHQWREVRQVDCFSLQAIRTGVPFPADAGTAPIP